MDLQPESYGLFSLPLETLKENFEKISNFEENEDAQIASILAFIFGGRVDAVEYLLEKGKINVNTFAPGGITFLELSFENLDMMEFLISKGANVNHESIHKMLVSSNVKEENVKLLCESGMEINLSYEGGKTLIMEYCSKGIKVEILKILCGYGGRVTGEDSLGNTSLHYLFMGGIKFGIGYFKGIVKSLLEIIKFLLSKGLNLNAKNKNGLTPLEVACLTDNFPGVKALLKCGAEYDLEEEVYGINKPSGRWVRDAIISHNEKCKKKIKGISRKGM
jgi:ankyrin repeat protein